jgi:2,4-dienoyl-CoA reductase-like NADH-dependent reductase (Old Yellow Enzyme family)
MTEEEIEEVVDAFGKAAVRAREAGFDAVQVHAAHAYLLSQFFSPYTNRRDDKWGGDWTRRLRLHQEIYRAVRAGVGDDYPVLIKFGVEDGFAGGLRFEEGKQAAVKLAGCGYDALEISQGLRGGGYQETEFRQKINREDQEAFFRGWAADIKKDVAVPVAMVGGLRSFDVAEQAIRNGEADQVSLSRPFIREPDLVNSWKKSPRKRATCISCNRCLETLIFEGVPLHCAVDEEEGVKEHE